MTAPCVLSEEEITSLIEERPTAYLLFSLANLHETFTHISYRSYRVTRKIYRNDLLFLESKGYIETRRLGNKIGIRVVRQRTQNPNISILPPIIHTLKATRKHIFTYLRSGHTRVLPNGTGPQRGRDIHYQ